MRNPWTRLPLYCHLPTPTNSKILRHRKSWRLFCEDQLQKLKEQRKHSSFSSSSSPRSDLFFTLASQLLDREEENSLSPPTSISWEELWHTLYEVTVFNIDITISELVHLLVNLSKYPEWQSRLRSEILQHVPPFSLPPVLQPSPSLPASPLSTPSTKTEHCPTNLNQLNQLRLLEAFISESARVHPAIELSFPERLTEDQIMSGFLFPKGTTMCIDVVAYNNNETVSGSNPLEFNPERFLIPDASKGENGGSIERRAEVGMKGRDHIFPFFLKSCVLTYTTSLTR
jgi:cytochrome P450